MSTTMELKDALIRNLQVFNAKERDHLMRFAYLGQNTPYTQDSAYMHPDFDQALRDVGSLDGSAKCIFAGMDYHLDWLFAALWLAVHEPHWQPASGCRCVATRSHLCPLNGLTRHETNRLPAA